MRSLLLRHRPSRATVALAVALFAALDGGNAYATATSFLLNTQNTSSAQTSLDGSAVAGKAALKFSDTNTTAGSSALNLSVASGHPPFTVSAGAGKVANLNADTLDGVDSAAFVRGSGSTNGNAVALPPGSIPFTGRIGPNVQLHVQCLTNGSAGSPLLTVSNTAGRSFNVFSWDARNPNGDPYTSGSSLTWTPGSFTDDYLSISLQQVAGGKQTVTQLTIGMAYRAQSDDCHFQWDAVTASQ